MQAEHKKGSDLYKLLVSFEEKPGIAAILSDSQLLEVLPLTGGSPECIACLNGELLTRRWLYEDRCPDPIRRQLNSSKFSSAFNIAYHEQALPLRRPDPDSEPHYEETLLTPPSVDGVEKMLWEYLRRRLLDFLTCDGLLALVPRACVSKADGVAVPFFLTDDETFRESTEEPLTEWTRLLRRIRSDLKPLYGARVPVVFPGGLSLEPDGGSFALPLLLARERLRANRVPEFWPLDVLATGGCAVGKVQSVEGVPAKRALAQRLGCQLFIAVTEQAGVERDFVIPPDTKWRELLPQLVRAIPRATGFHRACFNLAACTSPIAGDLTVAQREPSDWFELWQRLNRCRRVFGTRFKSQAERCNSAMGQIESQLGLSFPQQHSHIEETLSGYRQRRVFGRRGLLEELDRFIAERPGGLQLVTGKSGYGKTALLVQWLRYTPRGVTAVFCHLFRAGNPHLSHLEGFHRRLTAFLWMHGLRQLPPSGFGTPADNLATAFQEYARLPERARPNLLVVLDGLDEAEDPYFEPPFGVDIPTGIHIVASARTHDGKGMPRGWDQWQAASAEQQPIEVGRLDENAVSDWLTGDRELGFLAHNPTFLEEVVQKTQGCPQFLQDFYIDLRRVKNIRTGWLPLLELVPSSYGRYIRKQFEDSCKLPGGEELPKLMALLVAAKAPLSGVEIEGIRDKTGQQAVRVNLHNLPGQVARWISRSTDENQGLCLSLGNTLTREALEQVPDVKSRRQELAALLCDYCMDWRAHRRPYALRYLAAHLADAPDENRWLEIAALTKDEEYQDALGKVFPEQPALLLEILREAVTTAARKTEVAGIAELMLAHAGLADQLKREAAHLAPGEAPFTLARRMTKIVAGWNPALSALWQLLLAWELGRQNQIADKDKVLADLSACGRVLLVGHHLAIAAGLLPCLLEPNDPRLFRLAALLLNDEGKHNLVVRLARRRDAAGFTAAYIVLRSISPADGAGRTLQQARSAILCELASADQWGRAMNEARQEEPHEEAYFLLELGKVAVFAKRLDMLAKITERVAELHQSKDLFLTTGYRRLGGYRLRLGGYRAILHGLYGRELILAGQVKDGNERLARAETIADKLLGNEDERGNRTGTPARVSALINLADVWLGLPSSDQQQFSRSHSRRLLGKAFSAWRVMSQHPDNSNTLLCHRLADLARVYLRYLSSIQQKRCMNRRCLERLASIEFVQFLSPQDRDDFFLRVIDLHVQQPSLDMSAAQKVSQNIEDLAKRSRAIAFLANRLAVDRSYEELSAKRGSPWQAYYGLHLLEAGQADAAFAALANSLTQAVAPWKEGQDNIHLSITLAELGAAAGVGKQWDLSERCFNRALGTVRSLEEGDPASSGRLRFLLNLAEVAGRARNSRIRNTAMREAWIIGRQIAGLSDHDSAADVSIDSHAKPVGEPIELKPDQALKLHPMNWENEKDEVKVIETLCALAEVQHEVNRDTVWGFFDLVRARARRLQNIVQMTQAIAEVSETYRLMNRLVISVEMFQKLEDEVTRRLPAFRGKGARRDVNFCLSGFVLGLVKAGFPKWALAYADIPDLEEHDEAQRAFAVAYVAAYNDNLEVETVISAGVPELARPWWTRPAQWNFSSAMEKSREHLERIRDPRVRDRALRQLAELHAGLGRPALALRAASALEQAHEKGKNLHRIGRVFAEKNDFESFQKLLPACAWSYASTYVMLGYLARLRPDQSRALAGVFERHRLLWKPSESSTNGTKPQMSQTRP